jgi:hypothetical protein
LLINPIGTYDEDGIHLMFHSYDFIHSYLSPRDILLIVIVVLVVFAFLCYCIFGTIYVYCITGICDIPSRGFWLCCFKHKKRRIPMELAKVLLGRGAESIEHVAEPIRNEDDFIQQKDETLPPDTHEQTP